VVQGEENGRSLDGSDTIITETHPRAYVRLISTNKYLFPCESVVFVNTRTAFKQLAGNNVSVTPEYENISYSLERDVIYRYTDNYKN
jgi:hypothetical protein